MEINRRVMLDVKVHAIRLKSESVLRHMELQDLEHELMVHVLESLKKYDSRRSSLNTYINRVLERRSITILQSASMKKRSGHVQTLEYVDEYTNVDGRQNILPEPLEFLSQSQLQRVIEHLPKKFRTLCELMRMYTVTEISRMLQISKYYIYKDLKVITRLINCGSVFSIVLSGVSNGVKMKGLTILEELNIKELSDLESSDLKHISEQLQKLLGHAKVLKDKLEDSLHLKFYEKAKVHLAESGRETGTSRFVDGSCVIVADLPKKVSWDQEIMDELCSKLPIDRMKDLVKITYAIEEKKYSSWSDDTRKYFNAAREVSIGKTKFQILDGGEQ